MTSPQQPDQYESLPKVLAGRYEVGDRIGEGGMAVVHRALDNVTDTYCAIKVLRPNLRQPHILAQFASEADIAQQIRHKNVIRAFDYNNAGPHPFFAMELAEGGTLRDWIDTHGAMPPRMAVNAIVQVCKGINAVHALGVIHRDIKPSNVLINSRGVCKVTDFGIAMMARGPELAVKGEVLGTHGFLSPEQREDARSVDARSDVFSLGATLWAMLCGRVPPLNLFLDPGPELTQELPQVLAPVIRVACAPRRSQRYATVQDLGRALFDVRSKLPEIPPGAPPLPMKTSPYEVDDGEPAAEVRSTWTVPERRQQAPTAAQLYAPENRGRTISRESLLASRASEESARATTRERLRLVTHPVSIAAGVALLLAVLFVVGAVWSGRDALNDKAELASVRLDEWSTQVRKDHKKLVSELEAIGGDTSGLAPPTDSLPSDQRAQRLERYLEVAEERYRTARDKQHDKGASSRAHERIKAQEEHRGAYRRALTSWRETAGRFPGSWGSKAGGPLPPD